ncbi:hypothetical protein MKW98_027438 [Papaver atlanticum]|uniref:5'-3' exoribonuclease n=1 Tax=Papaver atlanticum TaxID=357466 RepID=A0AAD4TE07_9MAGN|nr:hypothetical protein MKW98_027438 [Papaver atlanticum]
MGVPSFYRWLVNRYPNVIVNAKEARAAGGEAINSSDPNPNGIEFDNLYLDMNGIIHPCFHPEDDQVTPPITFDEVFQSIFDYIDRLFQIVRPRKLLYLAIDGVAPRAKMNQQRSRRFRTAKDAGMAEAHEEMIRKEFEEEGRSVLPKLQSEVTDSNIITPGTEFMERLSKALHSYVRSRLNNDPGWKHIKVILSDANVPGEGEHKVMNFIRLQRNLPGYQPNTRHCLYGLDADLIMLALASHEPHFAILREEVTQVQRPSPSMQSLVKKPYQFLQIWTLREYLELDLRISDPPFAIDIEKIIDDFVLMCFFAGNDFLPHIPSLNINEGAIDLLISVYKEKFKSLGGYLVDMQKVKEKKASYMKLKRVEKFILEVGTYEVRIFKKRADLKERTIRSFMRKMANEQAAEDSSSLIRPLRDWHLENDPEGHASMPCEDRDVLENTKELQKKVKDYMQKQNDLYKQGLVSNDKVKLGLPGWKQCYYKEKFLVDDSESIRQELVKKYTEGLCWVLEYYFSGVPSWTWYYPYHYGPFASDFKGLGSTYMKFQMGAPFKPFDQLMAVLPPRSVSALPAPYWSLMTSEESNILDFYPADFEVDADGRRYLWQGTVKLPFINEERLLLETRKVEKELKVEDAKRNSERADLMFISQSLNLVPNLLLCNSMSARVPIDVVSAGLNGYVPWRSEEWENFSNEEDGILCVHYELPDTHPHIPLLLEEVELPEKSITEDDIVKTPLWHEYEGWEPPRDRLQIIQSKSVPELSNEETWRGVGSGPGFSAGRGRTNLRTAVPDTYSQPTFGPSNPNGGQAIKRQMSSYNSCIPRTRIPAEKDSSSGPSYGTRGPSYVAQRWEPSKSNQASWRRNEQVRESYVAQRPDGEPSKSNQAVWKSSQQERVLNTEHSGSSSTGSQMGRHGWWPPRRNAPSTNQECNPVSVGRGRGRGSPETPSVVGRGWGRGFPETPGVVGRGWGRGRGSPETAPSRGWGRGSAETQSIAEQGNSSQKRSGW